MVNSNRLRAIDAMAQPGARDRTNALVNGANGAIRPGRSLRPRL